MKTAKNIAGGASIIGELAAFLWTRKLWWMIPTVSLLLLFAILLLAGQATGVAPFIYTLF